MKKNEEDEEDEENEEDENDEKGKKGKKNFKFHQMRFLDSLKFMPSSISNLVKK